MKKGENIVAIAALLLSLTVLSAVQEPQNIAEANNREDEPVSSFEREYEHDESDEPYFLAEPDEPYIPAQSGEPDMETDAAPDAAYIPYTGAENVPGWMLPAGIMMCTGVLIFSMGAAGRKKGE